MSDLETLSLHHFISSCFDRNPEKVTILTESMKISFEGQCQIYNHSVNRKEITCFIDNSSIEFKTLNNDLHQGSEKFIYVMLKISH